MKDLLYRQDILYLPGTIIAQKKAKISMEEQKKPKSSKWYAEAERVDRIAFLAIFLVICAIFAMFWLLEKGVINPGSYGECALKRNYGIPCPTCGFTTAIKAFVKGRIINAFYIQPAATTGCFILIWTAFFSLLSAVIGINFSFLPPIRMWQLKYILIAGGIILAAGWAVTMARALTGTP